MSSDTIISVSTMRIREGGLELFKQFAEESTEFFEANEPWVVGICLYINEEGTEARSIQIHRDSESYERHTEVAASQIHEAYDYIEGLKFEVFGTPSDSLRAKLEGFGEAMSVIPLYTGFLRSAAG